MIAVHLKDDDFIAFQKLIKQSGKTKYKLAQQALEEFIYNNLDKIEANEDELLDEGLTTKEIREKRIEMQRARKIKNDIMSMGAFSHLNEIRALKKLAKLGAPKKEVKAVRKLFKFMRDNSKELSKDTLIKLKDIRLEPLTNAKYQLAKQFDLGLMPNPNQDPEMRNKWRKLING